MKYIDPDGRIADVFWDLAFTIYDTFNAVRRSAKGDHSGWVDVGIDVVAALLPCVPAGINKLDDAVKTVNRMDNTLDSVKGVKKLDEVTKLELRKSSVHNEAANKIMLGKYDNGRPTSYITKAGTEYKYFDLGDKWNWAQSEFGLSDNDMFDLFNKPFLDDGIKSGATFHFSHDPTNATGALKDEFKHIMDSGRYKYYSNTMTAVPID